MKKIFIFIVAIVALVAAPVTVTHAQLSAGLSQLDAANQSTGLSKADLGTTVGSIIRIVLSLIGTIFLILMIYAGILWMTARGNDEQIGTSKKIITAAIIGLAITLSAYAITYFVGSRLAATSGSASTGGVNASKVNCVDLTNNTSCMTEGQGQCEWIEATKLCDSINK
jgi:hypothetical protein